MGLIWGRQDPGGLHVSHMNFDIWDLNVNVRWLRLHSRRNGISGYRVENSDDEIWPTDLFIESLITRELENFIEDICNFLIGTVHEWYQHLWR